MRIFYLVAALILIFYAGSEAYNNGAFAAGLSIAGGFAILASALYREDRPKN